jgi:single-stranded-DNA-specific exonuclease
LIIDATVTLPDLDLALLHMLQKLAPFGAGNPTVRFAVTGLTVQQAVPIGRARQHRRVTVVDQAGQTAEVMWWNSATEPPPQGRFDLALTLSRDSYRQQEAVQLIWESAREQAGEAARLQRTVIDLRASADPLAEIEAREATEAHTYAVESLPGLTASSTIATLQPVSTLVIWQAPPGQDVLQQLLALTQPQTIYVVARPGPFDAPGDFLTRLMGLIKYSLAQHGGRLEIDRLANALGHRPATVRLALQWLTSQGKLRLIAPANHPEAIQTQPIIVVRLADQPPHPTAESLQPTLLELLRETAAYRSFVRRANLAALGLS